MHRRNPNLSETMISYTYNTWFEKAKLSFLDVMKLTHGFVIDMPISMAVDQIKCQKEIAISWFSFCREVCKNFAVQGRIGGPGHIVEVLSHFNKF